MKIQNQNCCPQKGFFSSKMHFAAGALPPHFIENNIPLTPRLNLERKKEGNREEKGRMKKGWKRKMELKDRGKEQQKEMGGKGKMKCLGGIFPLLILQLNNF